MAVSAEPLSVTEVLLNSLGPETRVILQPLTVRVEDEQYIVGRVETGEFVALSKMGARTIELFQDNRSLREVQSQLREEYGEKIEIDEFVIGLAELGFVKALDGHLLTLEEPPEPNLAWLQPHLVRWLFSKPVKIIYVILTLLAGFTLITHQELAPRYQDFFWSSLSSVVVLGDTAIIIVGLIWHELAHLAAARSLGLYSHIDIKLSTRLHELVVQTDLTSLWAVPRRNRYHVYLAGMAADLLIISVALLLQAYLSMPILAQNLLRALVLNSFLALLWQFQFFMRTDLYFVFMDLLQCHNLFEDSLAYLRYWRRRLWRCIFPLTSSVVLVHTFDSVPPHEQRKVKFYAWFMLIGSAISLFVFTAYGLPIMVELFLRASRSAWLGITQFQPWLFIDGAVTLAIEGGFQLAFAVAFYRNHRDWFSYLCRAVARFRKALTTSP